MGNAKSSEVRIASEVSPKTNRRRTLDIREHSDGFGCTTESVPPFRCPPFPLGSSGGRRTHCAISRRERFRAGDRCQSTRGTKRRGTLRCNEGRRERSPDPSTEERLGGVHVSVNPFFPIGHVISPVTRRGMTTHCRGYPPHGWTRSRACRQLLERPHRRQGDLVHRRPGPPRGLEHRFELRDRTRIPSRENR